MVERAPAEAIGSVLEAAALAYLARGWAVVPIQPRGKRPLLPWEEFQHRLPAPAEVRRWFRRWPDANLGIVTGAISGLLVVDVDPGHGGEDSLGELERTHGPLPATPEAATGGGGRHLYFAHSGGVVGNRVGLADGIDLRGDGGLVVAPPSLHPSGRRYRWLAARRPEELPPAPPPPWLLRLALGEAPGLGHPLAHWRRLVREGVREGARNNAVASFAGHLLWHGVDPDVTAELLQCWNRVRCRPPLSPEEVAATVASIRRTQERHDRQGAPDAGPPQEEDR